MTTAALVNPGGLYRIVHHQHRPAGPGAVPGNGGNGGSATGGRCAQRRVLRGEQGRAAATNLSAFLDAVRDQAALERGTRGAGGEVGEPVRDPAADGGSRYGCSLQVNGQSVKISCRG